MNDDFYYDVKIIVPFPSKTDDFIFCVFDKVKNKVLCVCDNMEEAKYISGVLHFHKTMTTGVASWMNLGES